MKTWINILFSLAVVAYMVVVLGFVSARDSETVCSNMKITLLDSVDAGFFNKRDIERIILASGVGILGYPVKDINTREIESELKLNPYIKKADLYFNVDGELRVNVIQRKPVIRIMTRSQNSFYIDKEGYILPTRNNFAPYIMIASGYFSEGPELYKTLKLDELEDPKKYKEWQEVLQLAGYIKSDKFLSAQFVQIYYNGNGDFELIPRVGAHQIIFGNVVDAEKKFEKLRVFYKEGLRYEGWNKYEKINLKFKNQIICTKR